MAASRPLRRCHLLPRGWIFGIAAFTSTSRNIPPDSRPSHTFASLLVSGGAWLEMIGKLLGHSQMQTTLRFAHLMDSSLRAGVDAVASAFRSKLRLVHDADDHGDRKTA